MRTKGLCAAMLVAALGFAAPASAQVQTARVDTTFSFAGLMDLPWTTSNLEREVVANAPDGGLFIAHEGPQQITLIRLTPDGQPYSDYVGAGVSQVPLAEPFNLSAMHVAPDGAVMLGGGRDLIQVDATGRVVLSFGTDGRTRIPYIGDGVCVGASPRAIFRDAAGGWIVVASRTYTDTAERGCTFVARVRADGSPDFDYGTLGNLVRSGLIGFDAAMHTDGTVEIIGRYAGQPGSWVERVRPDGRMLESFAGAGSLRLGDNGPPFMGSDGRILPDGSLIFVALTNQPTLALHRYRADHQFDTSFAGVGLTVLPLPAGSFADLRVLPAPDGGFVVRANAQLTDGGITRTLGAFFRIDARGFPDRTFGDNGFAIHLAAQLSRIVAWTMQPDGYLVYTVASYAAPPVTAPGVPPPPPDYIVATAHATRVQAVPDVVEFHNAITDHYFIAYDGLEARGIDDGVAGPGWQRTGQRFRPGGATPVCRFYGPGPNSHFFTVEPGECQEVKRSPGWIYEGLGFYATRLASGRCPVPLVAVNRMYNNRHAANDANHRFFTDLSLVAAMTARGWVLEGPVFCAKP